MQNKKIEDQAVANYLIAHPNFLVEHPEVFKALHLYHLDSTGISLLEKQIDVWRGEATKTQKFLEEIVGNVRNNQTLVEGVIGFSAELQKAAAFPELVGEISYQLKQLFSIPYVSLVFLEEPQLEKGHAAPATSSDGGIVRVIDHALLGLFDSLFLQQTIRRGNDFSAHLRQTLFPVKADSEKIESMAVLSIKTDCINSVLALASDDATAYRDEHGAEVLGHIITAVRSAFKRFEVRSPPRPLNAP